MKLYTLHVNKYVHDRTNRYNVREQITNLLKYFMQLGRGNILQIGFTKNVCIQIGILRH